MHRAEEDVHTARGGALDATLLKLETAFSKKEDLVEHFKSQHALLQNSPRYFPSAVAEFTPLPVPQQVTDPARDVSGRQPAGAPFRQYRISGTHAHHASLRGALEALLIEAARVTYRAKQYGKNAYRLSQAEAWDTRAQLLTVGDCIVILCYAPLMLRKSCRFLSAALWLCAERLLYYCRLVNVGRAHMWRAERTQRSRRSADGTACESG